MTDELHPSFDDLADLREELLDPERADQVATHLEGCADCSASLADLDTVTAVLASVGSDRVTMPADVASSIDEAIARARAEDAAGVTVLAERRESAPTARRRSLATKILFAGAAATLVAVAGFALNSPGSGSDDSAGSTAARDTASHSGGELSAAAGDKPGPAGGGSVPDSVKVPSTGSTYVSLPRVRANQVAAFARQLSRGQVATAVPTGRCAAATNTAVQPGVTSAEVVWRGDVSLLVADSKPRVARIYRCQGAVLVDVTRF